MPRNNRWNRHRSEVTIEWYRNQDKLRKLRAGKRLVLFPHATVPEIFEQFDADDSGFIEADELDRLLYSCALKCEPDDVQAILGVLDQNGDGKLDFDELQSYCNGLLEEKLERDRIEKERKEKERQDYIDQGFDPDSPMFQAQLAASKKIPSYLQAKSPRRRRHRGPASRASSRPESVPRLKGMPTPGLNKGRFRGLPAIKVKGGGPSQRTYRVKTKRKVSYSSRGKYEDMRRRTDRRRTHRMKKDAVIRRATSWDVVPGSLQYKDKYVTAFEREKKQAKKERKKFVGGAFVVCDHKSVVLARDWREKCDSAKVLATGGPYVDEYRRVRAKSRERRSRLLCGEFKLI